MPRQSTVPGLYLIATTIESAPTSGSTRVCENPASRIQAWQSAPVKSKPPVVSIKHVQAQSHRGLWACHRAEWTYNKRRQQAKEKADDANRQAYKEDQLDKGRARRRAMKLKAADLVCWLAHF
jgi:hypothetical protein